MLSAKIIIFKNAKQKCDENLKKEKDDKFGVGCWLAQFLFNLP
jgi:hypothetical protein